MGQEQSVEKEEKVAKKGPEGTAKKLPPQAYLKEIEQILDAHSLLLDHETVCNLDGEIKSPQVENPVWKLIYNSDIHGKSWSVFMDRVGQAERSVLLIKDKGGNLFGAYVPLPLVSSVNFYSNSETFIFSILPQFKVYRPTGYNQNHVYFNHGKASFPNGIGCGGQLEYFAFFLSDNFEDGHSRCGEDNFSTTFGNPQLSSFSDFVLDSIEIWMISPRDTESLAYKRSIIDNPETITLLEMTGREMHSKNIGRLPPENPSKS